MVLKKGKYYASALSGLFVAFLELPDRFLARRIRSVA